MRITTSLVVSAMALTACGTTQAPATAAKPSAIKVGPEKGSVLVVGGGQQGPEIFAKFIELAGGPDALIVEVPTAGDDSIDVRTVGRGLRAAGAKNVVVYHTTSKAVADADTFVAKIANARGVWFGGGRHYRLVNSYMGTKSQRAFEAVLARGGVVGGSSAGASILASYLVRGAPSSNNRIMNHPDYLTGFGYLRNTAVDQHVVARERLPDLYDSLTIRRRDLLAISEDEGTAWVVRGDTAELIGRSKGFVYNSRELTDQGKPFMTLLPGDKFDLGARRVISRAASASRLDGTFLDDVFGVYSNGVRGGAAVLVAREGKVLLNRAYGIPVQPRFTPETSVPLFDLGRLSGVLNAAFVPDSTGRMSVASIRRVQGIGGMQRARYDSVQLTWRANVDDLYRFELGRFVVRPGARDTNTPPAPFSIDTVNGQVRHAVYGTDDGMRNAWVRYPAERLVIMVLTNDSTADARAMAQRVAERVLTPR
ncbi:Type 1 glutamine amidotransferase-like domain-containing protein [Gemmatimonas sp.]|uniref:cyanophycinase n=1 Tax=Gemmatimonas sp. TaxID=1962908 RepID=UPI00333F23FC